MSLMVILILPLLAAVLCLLPFARRYAPAVTLASAAVAFALSIRVALEVAAGRPMVAVPNWIAVDGLSALVLLLVTLVGATAALFSWGYMAERSHGRRVYYAQFNMFFFSLIAVPALAEPNLVWIAVELTALFSVLLVGYDNTHEALEAAWKYVVLMSMGAAIALLGFLVLFWAAHAAGGGTYSWETLRVLAPRMPSTLVKSAFVLVLVGYGTKAGLVPLHTWLPDAHSQAPSPICALLSGVKTTSALYVILRFLALLPQDRTEAWTLSFGLVSVGVAAFLLLQVRDYKRLFAYSTVEHMGIVLMAAGLGNAAAQSGAMSQMLNHAITKSFCFYASGAALLAAGQREIASVRGLIRTSPAAGVALLLGGLAIAGAPPFAVFLSELSIFKAGLAQGRYLATGLLVFFITIAFFGILFHINRMVFGRADANPARHEKALPFSCVLALIVAAVPVVVLGVYLPEWLHELFRLAAASLTR